LVASDTSRVQIGYITKTHGLYGKVAIYLTTDVPDRLKPGEVVFVDNIRELTVESASYANGRTLVAFHSISTLKEAQEIIKKTLWAPKIVHDIHTDLWISDLFFSYVVDQFYRPLGKVKYVIENPASDILELDSDVLIPFKFITKMIEVKVGAMNDDLFKANEALHKYYNVLLVDGDKVAFAELPDGLLEVNTSRLNFKTTEDLN
jgi:16S rRNA processing protein RimM